MSFNFYVLLIEFHYSKEQPVGYLTSIHTVQEPTKVGEVHIQPTTKHPADARRLHAEEEERTDHVKRNAQDNLEVSI